MQVKEKIKSSVWQYFGAAFTEKKDGRWAVSLTRCLALVTFGYLSWGWFKEIAATGGVPADLLTTFYILIGVKGGKSLVEAWRGKGASSA